MKKNNIIFVGGVHGVGKTTLCNKVKEKLGIENYSSSELIRRYNSSVLNDDKRVNDITNNQNVLLKAKDKYIEKSEAVILDGHFTLINRNGLIECVPIETFKELGLLGILIVIDEPANIAERLKYRDDKEYDVNFIIEFQDKEIEYSESISKELGIDLLVLSTSDKLDKLYEFITVCEMKKD